MIHKPNDPLFEQQYMIFSTNVHKSWDAICNRDTIVSIIDNGVDYQHSDLKEAFGDEVGYDFIDDKPVSSSTIQDSSPHGTHLAGIIAAGLNNGIGISGISRSSLLSARAINKTGSSQSEYLADAIRWSVDQGADIINISATGPPQKRLSEAVKYAFNQDVLLVAPTGNGHGDRVAYPAAYDQCLAVSAIDIDDTLASYSNKGKKTDLLAPGTDILSTTTTSRGDYERLSGTSQASAVVSGIASLCCSKWDIHGSELFDHLKNTAVDLGLCSCVQGDGRVDSFTAVSTPPSPVRD